MSNKTDHKIPKIAWIDMCVAEPEKVAKFYSDLIGWGMEPCVEDREHTSYVMTDHEGKEVIGVCDEAVFNPWVKNWVPYVDVADFEDGIAKIEPGGGKIVQQGIQENEQKFCLFKDPSGAPMMMRSISE